MTENRPLPQRAEGDAFCAALFFPAERQKRFEQAVVMEQNFFGGECIFIVQPLVGLIR